MHITIKEMTEHAAGQVQDFIDRYSTEEYRMRRDNVSGLWTVNAIIDDYHISVELVNGMITFRYENEVKMETTVIMRNEYFSLEVC